MLKSKKVRKLTALLLALSMVLSLAACGSKSGSTASGEEETGAASAADSASPVAAAKEGETLAQTLGYGYTAEYSDLEVDWEYISSISAVNGKLFLFGYTMDEETYNYGPAACILDPASGAMENVSLPAMASTENMNESIQTFIPCSNGENYWVITDSYYWDDSDYYYEYAEEETEIIVEEAFPEEPAEEEAVLFDAEAEPEAETEDAAADEELLIDDYEGSADESYYTESNEVYTAKYCTYNGDVIREIDLTEAVSTLLEENGYFYPEYTVEDGDGNLLISTDTLILRFDADGNHLSDIQIPGFYLSGMVCSGNGTVCVTYYDDDGNMSLARVEGDALSDPVTPAGIKENSGIACYSGADGSILISDYTNLYSLDPMTGETTQLLNWLDSDINAYYVGGVCGSDDSLLVLMNEYTSSGVDYELGTLTKVPADQIPQRTVITLGVEYSDSNLVGDIVAFNRQSDRFRISIVDYSQYDSEENDYSGGADQLDKDIISGAAPDIISLDSSNMRRYISKGLLKDLTALMESRGGISMDELVTAALKGYMEDGRLYGMPSTFSLQTLYGSARLFADYDAENFNMEALSAVVASLDDDVKIMQYYGRNDFLSSMLYLNMDQYVDYAAADCNFDTAEFEALLEIASRLPEEYDYEDESYDDDGNYIYYSEEESLQQGSLLLTTGYIYSAYEIKNLYNLYTEENGIINLGYPTADGAAPLISLDNGLAISENVSDEVEEGAWAFICFMLENLDGEDEWSLPITKAGLEAVLQSAQEQSWYMDGDEKVYYDDYYYIGDVEYTISPLTDEQVDDFMAYIESAGTAGSYDSDLLDIITEEAAAYFSGDKSASEVASLIQNRVKIYLGENA